MTSVDTSMVMAVLDVFVILLGVVTELFVEVCVIPDTFWVDPVVT